MSLLLSKILGELGLVCEESQAETLLAAADRAIGTINTKINTKGATKLYMMRDIREVVSTTTVIATLIAGAFTDLTNTDDKDQSTKGTSFDSTSTTNPHLRFDFGSLATRKYSIIDSLSSLGITTIRFRTNTDGDTASPTTWSAWTTYFSSSSSFAKRSVFLVDINCRHIEIDISHAHSGAHNYNIFEVYDGNEAWGAITFDFQIFDAARSVWRSAPGQPTVANIDTVADGDTVQIFKIDMDSMPIPHKVTTSDMFRIQEVITKGKVNYSIELIKVDPCKV